MWPTVQTSNTETPATEKPIQNASSWFQLTYHLSQIARGSAVVGLGVLGYLGFSRLWGGLGASEQESLSQESAYGLLGASSTTLQPVLNDYLATSIYTAQQSTVINDLIQTKHPRRVQDEDSIVIRGKGREFSLAEKYSSGVVSCNLSRDRFVIGWKTNFRYLGQIIGANGAIGNEFEFFIPNPYSSDEPERIRLVQTSDGGFIAIAKFDNSYFGQRFGGLGERIGEKFKIFDLKFSYEFEVAILKNTEIVLTFFNATSVSRSLSNPILAQRLHANATKLGNTFQVNSLNLTERETHRSPVIASLSDGGFVIAWEMRGAFRSGIYARRFAADGSSLSDIFLVQASSEKPIFVYSRAEGGYIIVVRDRAYHYSANDIQVASSILVRDMSNIYSLSANSLKNNGFVLSWKYCYNPGTIYAQFHDKDANLVRLAFPVIGVQADWRDTLVTVGDDDNLLILAAGKNGLGIRGIQYVFYKAPTLVSNEFIIHQGEKVVLTSQILAAYDKRVDNATLVFTPSNIQHGQFEWVDQPGVVAGKFTQQQIQDARVQFVHDGSEQAPSYLMTVTNRFVQSSKVPAVIHFILALHSLLTKSSPADSSQALSPSIVSSTSNSLSETSDFPNFGTSVTLPSPLVSESLKASDFPSISQVDSDPTAKSSFIISSSPMAATSLAASSQTILPQWDVSVWLSVKQGQTIVLRSQQLQASYGDTAASEVVYSIESVRCCRFEQVAQPNTAISHFTQQQVNQGDIQFVHDGSRNSPSFAFTLSDGKTNSNLYTSQVEFTLAGNNIDYKMLAVGGVIGAGVVGTGAILAGIGIYCVAKKQNQKAIEPYRTQEDEDMELGESVSPR